MSEAYRDVIIRIKAEADSSVEKTLSGIGGNVDNAIRTFERGITAALNNINAAIKRLEAASGRLGGGGFGGDGAALMGGGKPIGGGGFVGAAVNSAASFRSPSVAFSHPTMVAGAQAAASMGPQAAAAFAQYQNELASAIAMAPNPSLAQVTGRAGATPYNRMAAFGAYAPGPGPTASGRGGRGGGLGFDRERLVALGIGMASGNWDSVASGVGTIGGTLAGMKIGAGYGAVGGPWGAAIGGMVGGMAGTLGASGAGAAYRNRQAFADNFIDFGAGPTGDLAGIAAGVSGMLGSGAMGVYAGWNPNAFGGAATGRARSALSMQQRATAVGAIDRATGESIAEFRGGVNISRAMLGSDGSLKGDLAATQSAMGSAATDEQRLQLRQRELELTRQISREQVQGAQATLAGLEREKAALEDMLARRRRQTDSASSAFGYASRGDQEAAVRAAEKYNSGQGATVSRREREAFESLAPQFGTENGMKAYEAEGRRRGGNMLDRFLAAIGAQKELGEMRGQAKSVRDEIDAKKDDKAEFEAKGKAAADAIQPAIDNLVEAIKDTFSKAANEVREQRRADVNGPQAAAAGRSRRGLSIA